MHRPKGGCAINELLSPVSPAHLLAAEPYRSTDSMGQLLVMENRLIWRNDAFRDMYDLSQSLPGGGGDQCILTGMIKKAEKRILPW